MGLDIRLPIGGMFFIVGLLLVIYGIATASDPSAYERSLYIDVNLWWGLAMLAFGAIFLVFGIRGGRAARQRYAEPAEERSPEEQAVL